MKLVIHATNVHQGGGETLLKGILSALKQPAVALLDERLTSLPALVPEIRVIKVAPNLIARLRAEFQLRRLSQSGDIVLCFGNLPPLLGNTGQVFVYLQNRYLTSSRPLAGISWLARLRIHMERCWLRYCLRDATILVQTETMMLEVKKNFRRDATVLPFLPDRTYKNLGAEKIRDEQKPQYDYLYVASGEPHKNHRRLLDAWVIMAKRGCRPSLCLTLDLQSDVELWNWVEDLKHQHDLQVVNQPLPLSQISQLYSQCAALIYPSLFESFGLPLLEAKGAGIPIIASERDYVRDVVVPLISFDPDSALSIARSVMRHQGWETAHVLPVDAESFLHSLVKPK